MKGKNRKPIIIYTVKMNRETLLFCGLSLICLLLNLLIVDSFSSMADIFGSSYLSGMVVVVDPGHGGIDGGTHDGMGFMEKNINLEVSLIIKRILESKNARVIMTRDRDISLEHMSKLPASRYRRDLDARRNIINGSGADVFVSIHVNSSRNPGNRGAMVFYHPASDNGKRLARFIASSIDDIVYRDFLQNSSLNTQISTGRYFILRETRITGVLVELAFITNPYDKALLKNKEFKERIALAICEGIALYLTSL